MLKGTIRSAALGAALLAFGVVGNAAAQQTVKIGAIYPLSGNAASAGNFSKAAIELAVDLINNGNPDLKDVPLATGNGSEALLALVDGKFMTFRVPYPMGFYAKGIDGRIDDSKGGWKGKGIWTTYATRAPFHSEGGKGTTSKLVKFQVRNSPLDK